MSEYLDTSAPGRRPLALAGWFWALCAVLGACGLPEEAAPAAVSERAMGLSPGFLGAEAEPGTQSADLGLSDMQLLFPARCRGSSATRTLELRSTGSSALTVRTLSVRGAAFRLVHPPSLPRQLAPGERLLLRVRFSPPEDRPDDLEHTGSLIINTSASGRPSVSVPLRGTVPPLEFSLRPSTLDFGSLRVGQARARHLVLRNSGACPVEFGGVDMSGPMEDAVLVGDLGFAPLGTGEERDVEVIVLCDRRGLIDAVARFLSTYNQLLGTLRVRGSCRP